MSKRYPGGILRKTPQTPSQTSAQGVWDMASVTQAVKENNWPIAGVPDPISKSLRFRSSASAYLNRTFSTPTNNKKWTWSGWIKRGTLSTASIGFFGQYTDASNRADFYFDASDNLNFYNLVAGSVAPTPQWITSQVFRDPSAWYHIIIVWDSNNATAGDRIIIYVNGSRVTAYSSQGTVTSGQASQINSAAGHNLGRFQNASTYFDGYMTEVYFIDGQALTPSSFGGTNDQTGVWQPIAYTGTYGTNGFYLPFSNTASTTTLGYDFSGNSNNWTTNNISLTSGSTYDSMVDVPTQWIPYNTAGDTGALWRGNYAVMNPLTTGSLATLSGANLNLVQTSGSAVGNSRSSFAMLTGKWYFETTLTANSSGIYPQLGIMTARDGSRPNNDYPQAGYSTLSLDPTLSVIYMADGTKQTNGSASAYGSSFTNGDVIGIAIDSDNGAIYFSKNGTWQNSGVPTSGSSKTGAALTWTGGTVEHVYSVCGYNNLSQSVNFGQRPFSYTPPAGFKTLCTTNLSTPTIGATATTQANDYFNAVTYTGTSGTQAVTGVGFQPDWVWIKARNSTLVHVLQDAVRGTTAYLQSNSTAAENTNTANNWFRSFDSDGFTVATLTSPGGVSTNEWNNTGYTYVSWNWKANGSGSTNTAGSITSTVSANTTAGFSIVTYTGTGVTGTLGHGLGVAPAMIIVKSRSNASNWYTYHISIGNTGAVALNLTDATITSANFWNNTSPTSSVFTASAGSAEINGNGLTYVAYCFAQVAGYSAFGSYTGNGSSDGPFVFTGFRPKYVLIKASSIAGENWYVVDATRSPYNAAILYLSPNNSGAEASPGAAQFFDFLSNGFKLRVSGSYANSSGETYIYMAFAESPFKYALAR